MRVRVLADDVINQISAGEVVDRPASVVRELVDNAVDAGAGEISVYLEEGGCQLVRVVDNGCGMDKDDAVLAFERHATSKLREAGDLSAIDSLGFRGEALPSIAAVSKVRMRTRSGAAPAGVEVVIHGGRLKDVRGCAGPAGTEVAVESLFFNTPARRKFLRQPATEEQRVKQWLLQSAIARPEIHYRLFAGEREPLNLPKRETMTDRALSVFRGTVVSFNEQQGELELCGVLGHPSLAQADAAVLVVLVNRRLVTDRLIMRAVREGFSSTLKDREYPVGFIGLTMPAQWVDVNVHPQKSEVRFRSKRELFAGVREAVSRAVARFTAPFSAGPGMVGTRPADVWTVREDRPAGVLNAAPAHNLEFDFTGGGAGGAPAAEPAAFRFSNLRYLGQALQCYLFCEHAGGIYVVDMHAAHERCNYNLIRNRFRERRQEAQLLAVPLAVELTEAGLQNCIAHKPVLEELGFMLEAFGETTLLVRGVPAMLAGRDTTALIKEIAALDLDGIAPGSFSAEMDQIAARIACHASVRAGYAISREEVQALFAQMDAAEFSAACPHGRPVAVSFSAAEIEKWFGRDC